MSNPSRFFYKEFSLPFRISLVQLVMTGVLHCLATWALWINPLFPFNLQLALTMALVASLTHSIWVDCLRRAVDSVIEINFSEGQWQVTLRDGRTVRATLGPRYVSPILIILQLRWSGGRVHVPFLRDNCDPDTLRRLYVFLHHGGWRLVEASRRTAA